jgi:hypothetical protein
MIVSELIAALSKCEPDADVSFVDENILRYVCYVQPMEPWEGKPRVWLSEGQS